MDIITLKRVLAEVKKYGASYFLNAPLEHFTRWLESQLYEAEARADEQAACITATCPKCGETFTELVDETPPQA